MKKFFLALAAVAAIAFVGCSKDDDDKKTSDLAGTTWTWSESYDYEAISETLQFKSGGVVIWSGHYSEGGGYSENYSHTGSYTYDEPNVTIRIVKDEDWGPETYFGTVDGKTLRLYDEWGDDYTFTKQ